MSVALVTGGASGIGAATADLLRTQGHTVVTWDLAPGADLAVDVSDAASVDAAVRQTVEQAGTPTLVAACAGVGRSGQLLAETVEGWERTLAVNLTGAWLTLRAAARALTDAGSAGSLVLVSSVSGTLADRDMGAYCVSKAGADMLVRVAAQEWGPHGIRVNAVGPGVTETPMLGRARELPGWVEGLAERTPLGGLGRPEDVAAVVVGVLGLPWVTGQVLHADGGLALHSPIDAWGQQLRLRGAS